jgi:hypothetical protein
MLEKQIEMAERRETLRNDLKVREQQQREQGSTFLAQTHSEMGGRFSSVGAQTVIGAEPTISYPAAAPHQRDPCGIEPPLGYRIDELEPAIAPPVVEAQASDPASDAPSPTSLGMFERGAGSSFRRRRL